MFFASVPVDRFASGHASHEVPMDALQAINSRVSAVKLTTPAPSAGHLEIILKAGTRAPDHGRLAPWRFIVIEGAGLGTFGDAMAEMRRQRYPDSTDDELDSERRKPLRAPMIVAVAAHTRHTGKVPEIEQVLAVGAAVQNMFLAAHALGYGVMWKTGAPAFDPSIKRLFGLEENDQIVAFLYLGTVATPGPFVETSLEGIVKHL
jgi:nitroreductase